MQLHITAQYIKDLSFENPRAPESFAATKEQPDTGISVDINARKLKADLYEVELKIAAKSEVVGKPLFLIELNYAGIFNVTASGDELETALLVQAPSLLFPFARQIIASSVQSGGFPPLLLDSVDFAGLYREKKALRTY